ncbi:MAG TPA: PH domain-containing protein [Candidatus Methylomirabilis sp.]|nr:PH domain-containing protein [Candidatus Methylomirabilis sp.]
MIDLSKLPGGAADEENVFFLRPHWLVLLPIIAGFGVVLVLPFAVWFGLQTMNPAFFETPGYETLYVLGASAFFLYAWLFLFQIFIDYFLDIWIVTTHRIIDIQQHGMFGRTTSELLLDRVQDVSSDVRGFIHTVFDYGNVHVQTAGERERFVFENVPHPVHVSKRILELAERRRTATPTVSRTE